MPVDLKYQIRNRTARAFYERSGWQEVELVESGAAPHIRYRLATEKT